MLFILENKLFAFSRLIEITDFDPDPSKSDKWLDLWLGSIGLSSGCEINGLLLGCFMIDLSSCWKFLMEDLSCDIIIECRKLPESLGLEFVEHFPLTNYK